MDLVFVQREIHQRHRLHQLEFTAELVTLVSLLFPSLQRSRTGLRADMQILAVCSSKNKKQVSTGSV